MVSAQAQDRSASFVVRPDVASAYALACNDPYLASDASAGHAPPLILSVAALTVGVQPWVRAWLTEHQALDPFHLEERLTWHRPLVLGETLTVRAQPEGSPRRQQRLLTVNVTLTDAAGACVGTTRSTLMGRKLGPQTLAPVRVAAQDFAPQDGRVLATWRVPPEQPERYAQASGDRNAIHLDDAAAQAVGLPGRILHGMCTLAFAGLSVRAHHGGHKAQMRALGARFAQPVFVGDTLTCHLLASSGPSACFEVTNQHGERVLSRGTATLA